MAVIVLFSHFSATGIHFHPEVLDTKTMSVIRKTACHLAQHDKYHSPGVDNYISLQPSVSNGGKKLI